MLLSNKTGNGFEVIVRPHPQFTSMFPERMKALSERYADYTSSGEIIFELDFSGNESIFTSDLLITDWSGIAIEFSYCSLRPCIFINSPMKVMNPNYKQYGLDVLEIDVRDKLGVSVDLDNLNELGNIATRLISDKDAYKVQIEEFLKDKVFHPGRSGEAGGKYIISQLNKKRDIK